MPYIGHEERIPLGELAKIGARECGTTEGRLNYLITRLVHEYTMNQTSWYGGCPGYTELNKALGVLDAVHREFYRTVVAPFEDDKRKENGPVSELDAP
jgi:hypothetical protein